MTDVVVVIGAGLIGQAIARRVSYGKHVILADLRPDNAEAAAEVFRNAGFEASTATVDVSSRESITALVEQAVGIGPITTVIHAAGVSASQASPEWCCTWTCTARRSCWRSSGRSSPRAVPAG